MEGPLQKHKRLNPSEKGSASNRLKRTCLGRLALQRSVVAFTAEFTSIIAPDAPAFTLKITEKAEGPQPTVEYPESFSGSLTPNHHLNSLHSPAFGTMKKLNDHFDSKEVREVDRAPAIRDTNSSPEIPSLYPTIRRSPEREARVEDDTQRCASSALGLPALSSDFPQGVHCSGPMVGFSSLQAAMSTCYSGSTLASLAGNRGLAQFPSFATPLTGPSGFHTQSMFPVWPIGPISFNPTHAPYHHAKSSEASAQPSAEPSSYRYADHLLPGGHRSTEPTKKRRIMKERYNCRRCGQLKRGHVCTAPAGALAATISAGFSDDWEGGCTPDEDFEKERHELEEV